ncbi:MAG: hypothetical protein ACI4OT_01095 [Bacilli bacterium]
MKILKNILFIICCNSFVFLYAFILNNTNVYNYETIISENMNSYKTLNSKVLYKEIIKEDSKETIVNEEKTLEKEENVVIDENKEDIKEIKVESEENILDSFVADMTAYGVDCYGCSSNRTASGYYIGDGNIYYNDNFYGKVRILAGDKSYPFGTIVRMYIDNNEIIGIVLDRGSNIGFDKKYAFDLLFNTNKEAQKFGSKTNIKFEILRRGY